MHHPLQMLIPNIKIERQDNTSSVDYLINTLESNGIGVNKVVDAKGLALSYTV